MNLHLSTIKLCRKIWHVNFPDKGMGANELSI